MTTLAQPLHRARDVADRVTSALRHGTRHVASTDWGGDEVLLVRDASIWIEVSDDASEADISAQFARAIVEALRRSEFEGTIIRFGSRAEFAAAFLAQVVAGGARQWYFSSLRREGESQRRTVRRILREHRGELAGVLAELHRSGALEAVLAPLAVEEHWAVWIAGLGGSLDAPQICSLLADLGSRGPSWNKHMDTDVNPRGRETGRAPGSNPADDAEIANEQDRTIPASERSANDSDSTGEPAPEEPAVDVPVEELTQLFEGLLGNLFEGLGTSDGSQPSAETDRSAEPSDADADEAWESIHDGIRELRSSIEEATSLAERFGREFGGNLERSFGTTVGDEEPESEDSTEALAAWLPLASLALDLLRALDVDGVVPDAGSFSARWASQRPTIPDWGDPIDLARSVAAMVRFAMGEFQLHADRDAMRERLATDVDELFSGFDWLHVPTLVEELFSAELRNRPTPATPPSPRLRFLESALARAISSCESELTEPPVSATNALRVFGALMGSDPALADEFDLSSWIPRALERWGQDETPAAGWVQPAQSVSEKPGTRVRPETGKGFESACSGLFLLLRPLGDLRLHRMLEMANLDPAATTAVLTAIGLRLAGVDAATGPDEDERLDGGLRLWAGPDGPKRLEALRVSLEQLDAGALDRIHAKLLARMRGLRLARWEQIRVSQSQGRLIAVDAESRLPCFVTTTDDIARTVGEWLGLLTESVGETPVRVACDPGVWTGAGEFDPKLEVLRADEDLAEEDLAHVVDPRWLDSGQYVDTGHGLISVAGRSMLAVWCQWLAGFESSTPAYALEQFVRRCGRIRSLPDRLVVELDPLSLDIVLERADYFAKILGVPWLPTSGVEFRRSR